MPGYGVLPDIGMRLSKFAEACSIQLPSKPYRAPRGPSLPRNPSNKDKNVKFDLEDPEAEYEARKSVREAQINDMLKRAGLEERCGKFTVLAQKRATTTAYSNGRYQDWVS